MSQTEINFLKDKDIRIIKQKKKSEFTTLYNDCINDERLSIGALAILVYIMSKPENWNVMISDLKRRFSIGRNKTYNIISELCSYGYMKRIRETLQDGTVAKWVIVASDKPIFGNSQEDDKQPLPENQDLVPDPQNRDLDVRSKKSPQLVESTKVVQKSNENHPDPYFGEVHPYIQKKDFLIKKENIYCAKKSFEKEFEEFWIAYDNKKGKEKCRKTYAKLLRDKGVNLHDNIMYAISEQKRERTLEDSLGIWNPPKKMPLTWLNGHHWDDTVKTEEQLHEERKRAVRKISNKPMGKSKVDQYHDINARVIEAGEREMQRLDAEIAMLEREAR